uniref:B30.2/SPRY domain-containing protein n=1 Tax=Anas zonorhyncha TaxID=75864 RepID=A0A8B9UMS5_9AVES
MFSFSLSFAAKERAKFGESLCLTKGNWGLTMKVTLDPDTAHPQLVLFEDNTSVRLELTWQAVPNNPERFDCCFCVLGREEFRGGKHCWKVELRGELEKDSNLAVGVARASVKRKGGINMSPEEGIWALQYDEGQIMTLTSPPTRLSVSPVPMRIWVCLDYPAQQVSFINADDGKEIYVTGILRDRDAPGPVCSGTRMLRGLDAPGGF